MSRKKKAAGHANHERWLVSYADFITLLFAFFVVLFSSSQVDKRKVGKLALAIQDAFQQMGIFQAANSRYSMVTSDPTPTESTRVMTSPKGFFGEGEVEKMGVDHSTPKGLGALRKELEQALGPQLQRHEVGLNLQRDGLIISLREIGFFDSGSAQLRPSSEPAVRRIAQVLVTQPNNLRIEGHTDNVPIHNGRFASNWELSTARATEMVKLFITQYGFPPVRLAAGGYAEYHPAATNNTSEGRAQNRRVDIVVLPSASEEPKSVGTR
jgi:chemotaxis protein MotB